VGLIVSPPPNLLIDHRAVLSVYSVRGNWVGYSVKNAVCNVHCKVYSAKNNRVMGNRCSLIAYVYWYTGYLSIQYTGIQKGSMGNGKGKWKRVRLV
jgi:hypothetical protein